MTAITSADPVTVTTPEPRNTPHLTLPQWLAFLVLLVFVVFAFIASEKPDALVQPSELEEIRLFALFLVAALLPSDALVRFGRNLLFRSVPDPREAAAETPRTTVAQWLAFGAFVIVAALTLVKNDIVSTAEFGQINEVARVVVLALLPSDAAVRFGRALFYRSDATGGQPTTEQLKRV